MKVVITDYTFPSLEIEEGILRAAGVDVVGGQCKTTAELIRLVADADAVITQFAPVTAEVIGAMGLARVIVRYGIGVDNVDLDAARARGIPVCNVPDYCIDEVADHTLALILATTRQVVTNAASVRSGKWGLATPLERMLTLRDLTVGVVGFGRIGREVAARLRVQVPGARARSVRLRRGDRTSRVPGRHAVNPLRRVTRGHFALPFDGIHAGNDQS